MSTLSISPARKIGRAFLTTLALCVLLVPCCQAQISVQGGLTHEFVVRPGQSYTGDIVITNNAGTSTGLEVTQTDYFFLADGSNVYGEPGSVPLSNAEWINLFSPPRAVAPRERISIPYRIDVPDDPSLAGTYWSMVMIATLATPAEATAEGEIAIHQVFRYGIQIVTHIGDTGERKISILDVKLIREEEGPVLQLDVENTGERWVRPSAWVELYDEQGATVGRVESSQLRIYPGCSVRHRFVLSEVTSGHYKALVVFDNGDEYVWGAQYDLEL